MIFCYFTTNKNFDNCCVFPAVQNMSDIFVTCYLKNNHIKCFSFLEDCCIFLQDMHFSWAINICSATAVREDEVKACRVWFSLQPLGTKGALVKTETGESLHGEWACSSPASVSSVGYTASSTPFLWGEFMDSSKLLIWRGIFLASPQVFAVSLYSKAVWTKIWRKTNPNDQKSECKVN